MTEGAELRALRREAGVGITEMVRRTIYSKSYLCQIETGVRSVTDEVREAYYRVLGCGVDDEDVRRREFFTWAAVAAAHAPLINDLSASLAGGDPIPLAVVQTSHAVDHAVAAILDGPTVARMRGWADGEDSPIVRVNAAGILAKTPGESAARHVADVLTHDDHVRTRYLTAVVARVAKIDHATAVGYIRDPATIPQPRLLAARLTPEVINPNDAGARWCAATLLRDMSPLLG